MSVFARRACALLLWTLIVAAPAALADTAAFPLSSGNFSQNWSNTGLITADDNWSGVPSITGFRGDGLTGGTGVNPQTVTGESAVVDVNANRNDPNTFTTGGVAEFQLANPAVALNGSGTARAPYLQLYLNASGRQNLVVSYNLRDLDGSIDNSVQPFALHYKVGAGAWTNVAAGFVSDASSGPSLATLVTAVSVTLPAAVNNQPLVQVRIITTDAAGNDEWVGIDDITVTSDPFGGNLPPTITAPPNPIAIVDENDPPFTVNVSGSDDNNVYNWSATAGAGISGVTVTGGQGTSSVTYEVTLLPGFDGTATFTATLSDNVNAAVNQAVNITVNAGPPPPLDHVVISQIYGGGGNSGATYRNDYVELFNASAGNVDLGGWTIQYASATGTAWQIQPLGGIMQPGEYYLIELASGGAVGAFLPTPNVSGTINMSATAGKMALVSAGDPLDGCPSGDPLVVDLVGYGSTANCREGATNAPGASNTTATFRKNDGYTDTDHNGADFQVAAPNPRRTTPIQEIGPYVLTVDPRNNASAAPRDASMTVTFTEDVTVDANWFNINCVSTGNHNNATVALGPRVWIVTPNVNFQAGEQCTATIVATAVHDADFDDGNPNTDTLTANYSWTFTVSTGTAPAYPISVHLTFGNPSNAIVDVFTPNNYLMEKPEYSLSYNRDRGTPNWVSWHLADEWVGTLTRVDTFRPDPAVPSDWYRVHHFDYSGSGFDRGHMVPNADRDKETSIPINQATFLMSNMIPQAPDNNQGPWANLENALRALLPSNELYIVAGGAGTGGTGSNGFANTIAGGNVTVPASTWKCALVLSKASGDDVARVTAGTQTICVIMPNVQGIRNDPWQNYLVSVDAVETLSGYNLFDNISEAVENAVEAGVNGVNPPGVANQTVNTDEDTPKSFTLDVAAANNNPLTFTILSGPSNGSLSGTGANRTYTPALNFNGTDSFTYRVNDGPLQSNIGTVTINVAAVNDAPVASITVPPTTAEGSLVTATVSVTDVENDSWNAAWTVTKNGSPYASGSGASFSFTPDDNGNYGVSVTVTDAGSANGSDSETVVASNVNPVIGSIAGPTSSLSLGTPATISVTYSDAGAADTHTALVSWDDASTSTVSCAAGTCTASHTYAAAGVYGVTVVVSDDDGGAASTSFNYVIVTDAAAGFVTGGGWINSPTGGKGHFSLNPKYEEGVLTGKADFKAGSLTFESTSLSWLVVSGSSAQLNGAGAVNGTAGYSFLVTVSDSPDKYRIRIWETSSGTTVYDNVPGGSDDIDAANPQSIGSGSIVIHP